MDMHRTDPAGNDHPPTAHVFGNECGERVKRINRAWTATCRRAGITDLHFHDLRREFASRFLERGAGSPADVQATLGHASLTMTQRYLGVTDAGLHRAFDRFAKAARWADVTDNDERRTTGAQTPKPATGPALLRPATKSANVLN